MMKILFLCGSCESGKDGVGDYTIMLAEALIRMNHTVSIIALNDKHIQIDKEECYKKNDAELKLLRISKQTDWAIKSKAVTKWVQDFSPNWISLQYVPFSFNDKGLPFRLADNLRDLIGKADVHIMFHEIWVGIKKNSPRTHLIYKFFQKRIAKALVKELKPKFVSTSNRVYQLALQSVGINSEILPLFSNIPVASSRNEDFIARIMQQAAGTKESQPPFETYCVFGSIFPDIKLDLVIEEQMQITQQQNKKMLLLFLGRTNHTEVARLQQLFKNRIAILNLGELSVQDVSSVLQLANQAIATTPREFIGKSGVYAVLKRHGLPVLCPFSIAVPQYKMEIDRYYELLESKQPEDWDVKTVAKKLYDNFSVHTNI